MTVLKPLDEDTLLYSAIPDDERVFFILAEECDEEECDGRVRRLRSEEWIALMRWELDTTGLRKADDFLTSIWAPQDLADATRSRGDSDGDGATESRVDPAFP